LAQARSTAWADREAISNSVNSGAGWLIEQAAKDIAARAIAHNFIAHCPMNSL
jgi:hypothetical protein